MHVRTYVHNPIRKLALYEDPHLYLYLHFPAGHKSSKLKSILLFFGSSVDPNVDRKTGPQLMNHRIETQTKSWTGFKQIRALVLRSKTAQESE
jgi:hypothetical protein